MSTREPDYHSYSLAELREARASINERQFEERTKLLDALIRDRESVSARIATPQRVTMANDQGDIAAVKPGRGVSFGRGLAEIIGSVLFAAMWINVIGDSPFGTAGVWMGYFIGVSGVIGGAYHLYNAFSDNRFTEHDIKEPGAEVDPFDRLTGRARGKISDKAE